MAMTFDGATVSGDVNASNISTQMQMESGTVNGTTDTFTVPAGKKWNVRMANICTNATANDGRIQLTISSGTVVFARGNTARYNNTNALCDFILEEGDNIQFASVSGTVYYLLGYYEFDA